jgi:hypothetical protein
VAVFQPALKWEKHLGDSYRREANAIYTEAARTIGEDRARSNALIALAPYLKTEQLAEVLAAVMIVADEYPRSKARYTRILQILA